MGYAPLDLLSKSEQPGREFESRKEQLLQSGAEDIGDISTETYISFFLSNDFLNLNYQGKLSKINQIFLMNMPVLSQATGISMKQFIDGTFDPRTEWKDLYLAPVLWEEWGKNKQVYKPDADFADALLSTDIPDIYEEQIDHLPCRRFYIDLSDCKGYDPIVGIFVSVDTVMENGNKCLYVTEYLLSDKLDYFSFYTGGIFKDGKISFPKNTKNDLRSETQELSSYIVYSGNKDVPISEREIIYKKEKDRVDTTLLGIQMLAYLTVSKPDIEEDQTTKKTYRKSSAVKNKFSEVQRWEVGIRYGKAVRTQIQEAAKKAEEEKTYSLNSFPEDQDIPAKKRRSPVPHFRCAHWQHYRTGEGRKNLELRWIEPIFVGFGDTAKDVVIHKVKA